MQSFDTDPTRKIQAGDTPGFDDEQVSLKMSVANIAKGKACVVIDGNVTIATAANVLGRTPFVPTETQDNSGGAIGAISIKGIGPQQQVALALVSGADTINPGDLVQISATAGEVEGWERADNNTKYARYIGTEAGVFSKGTGTPYDEGLSVGRVPDQPLVAGASGWFRLLDASAGVSV